MDPVEFIFVLGILVFSVIAHEISHGYMAEYLGDPTARLAGRLTLNPIPHIDLFGSIILPALMAVLNTGFIIGWAKPVPYNPYNLSRPRFGGALVALAGPLSNLALAVSFGLLIRFSSAIGLSETFIYLASFVVLINCLLAFFNLLPIPPLDGSKILFAFLPYHFEYFQGFLERYGFFILIFTILFLWRFLVPVPLFLFKVITGVAF